MNPIHLFVLFWLGCALAYSSANPARAGTITGTVQDASGEEPIANARVTLFVSDLTFFREDRSDEAGQYMLGDVPTGMYLLGVSALRFEYVEVTVTVSEGTANHDFTLGPETEEGNWETIGNTLPEFFDATDISILRPDGKIFYCHDTVDPLLFDPVTGDKSFPSGSPSEQGCMNASLLPGGRILMAGGQDGSDPGSFTDAIPWVKVYDPEGDSWEWLPDMQLDVGRWYPGLARLSDGSFLVMGGGTAPDAVRTDTCERFNLDTLTWTFTDSMALPTEFPPSALLHTGEVLMTWSPPQLYDPSSGTWRLTGDFNQSDRGWPGHCDHSIVVLDDGKVLAVGIRTGEDGGGVMGEVYDPGTESWRLTSNPDLIRFQTELVQLPDGRLLVAGGETEAHNPPVEDVLGIVTWCDLYDPDVDSWRRVADMQWFREYHAVTLLAPDGRVLTTGGTYIKFQVGPTSADIEAYTPPYLLRGVRPQITSISAVASTRGCPLTITIAPQTQITSVVLMGTGVTTHWVDAGVPRRLVLPVEQTGDLVSFALPSDQNVLPLGYYMIFAMVDDIPSVAEIIEVQAGPPCSCDGDANGDGAVDPLDAGFVLARFGCPVGAGDPDCDTADQNGDGDVDPLDSGFVLARFGECP